MSSVPCFQVDAFTDQPFRGNPAAVCLLESEAPDAWQQDVAAEMNLAETAFLVPLPETASYQLRWFTPEVEVDLCGHATLASAHVLWSQNRVAPDATIRFHTKSGVLTAQKVADKIQLQFPAIPVEATSPPDDLIEALGCDSWDFVGKTRDDYLLALPNAKQVRQLQPDFAALKKVQTRGVIVTAPGTGTEFDMISRFFAPAVGVPEDPVTGSAHCALATFWAERLGKTDLVAHQASKRGGTLYLKLQGDRVELSGNAVLIWKGELEV